jgi:uncharacterized membrane protein YgcG
MLGLAAAAPTAALADTSAHPAPTVTQNGSTFTVDLPGVGSLTFIVEPATGTLSQVVVAADSGFGARTPKITDEGVEVSFTDASGTPTVLQAEVDSEDGMVTVKPEADTEGEEANAGRPAIADKEATEATADDESTEAPDHAAMGDDQNDAQENETEGAESEGQDEQKPTSPAGAGTPATPSAGTSSANRSEDGAENGQGSDQAPASVSEDNAGPQSVTSSGSSSGTTPTSGPSDDGGSGADGGSGSHDGGGSSDGGSGD